MKQQIIAQLQKIAVWVDDRLHVTKLFESTAGHHVPKSSGSWFYVFGSGTLLCFVLQIVTGSLLAFVYVPSASEAYSTLEYMTFVQKMGWYLRGMHNAGSLFMVTIMILHMTQVFLFGAYKYPRELTWVSGCVLLYLTLGMAFTGEVLRFDQDAYWGLGIGVALVGRVPLIGENLIHLMLGGPIIAGETLSRFFSLHVFIIPGLLIATISMHLRLVLAKGINEFPRPGHLVKRETYDQEYAEIIKKEGVPFFPKAISKDLIFSAIVIFGILLYAFVLGPQIPNGSPNPTEIDTVPRPDLPFMWIFAVAALLPPYLETVILLVSPIFITILLFLLPFISGTGEKSATRRPAAVIIVLLTYIALGVLTYLGIASPWSPEMRAWTSDTTKAKYIEGRSPLELQGAVILQYKQCRNCHAIDGVGGHRGPDLADVGTRLTSDQLIRQVVQGGGNMPAYGHNITPDQVTAVVTYMASLSPNADQTAKNSTFPAKPPSEKPPASPKAAKSP
ncbi:MAG: cytochrome b N-terminal domain-containing protein [Chthoniobacterales bacterium]